MNTILYNISEKIIEKNLTIILGLSNFEAGKVLRSNAPLLSLFWRQLIQVKKQGATS